jgi:hypothetical protein
MDYMAYPKMGADITALLKTEKPLEILTRLEHVFALQSLDLLT